VFDATTANFYAATRNPDGSPRTLKSWCRKCSNNHSKEWHWRNKRRANLHPVDAEPNVRLPIGPFREWMLDRLARLDGSEDLLAYELGVDARACYRWLHETRTIGLDQVDRALIQSGTAQLWELYPELYEDDGQRELLAA
jgi:hypothetical protein